MNWGVILCWASILIALFAMCLGGYIYWRGAKTAAATGSVIEAAPDLWLGASLLIMPILPLTFGISGLLGVLS